MNETTENGSDVFLTIRVPRELRDALNQQASANERTAAAEVRIALRKHLRKQLEAQSRGLWRAASRTS